MTSRITSPRVATQAKPFPTPRNEPEIENLSITTCRTFQMPMKRFVLSIIAILSFGVFNLGARADSSPPGNSSSGNRAVAGLSAPRWRVVDTAYPSTDVVVAGCTVQDFGAKGDSLADDTKSFSLAMQFMAEHGGGAVFVPAGRYRINGSLVIPTGVTLRGDWEAPATDKPLHGTILMAFEGRGNADGAPFIQLQPSSGIKNLSIWYPEQDAAHITPYPFCIKHAAEPTVENVTLVNPYQGIQVGPEPNGTHIIRNVYGTPLATGITFDMCEDTGRIENVHFDPSYWSRSGLPGAPAVNGPHTSWMLANGVGARMFRSDWECCTFIRIAGYKVGIEILPSLNRVQSVPPYGHFYDSRITGCGTAVLAIDARFPGFLFTDCILEGIHFAVETSGTFNSFMGFHSCTLRGKDAAVNLKGKLGSVALFQHCNFVGEAALDTGCFSLLGCTFNASANHIRIGESVRVATIAGSHFKTPARITNLSTSRQIKISDAPVPESRLPKIVQKPDKTLKPRKSTLYVVTDPIWGAAKDGITDDSAAVQKALDAAGKDGGGIVFLPGGEYALRKNISVPGGVELRGPFDVSNEAFDHGAIIRVFTGRGNENGTPLVVLAAHSGMHGLNFVYPEQKYDAIVPYPYTVQGRGDDIYVINTSGGNPYKFMDFMTYRCDRHCLDRVFAGALRVGIAVGGGSVGGQVLNANLNPGNWTFAHFRNCPGRPPTKTLPPGADKEPVDTYVSKHLEAFIYGNCSDELEFNSAVCPCRYGQHFVTQDGKGAAVTFLAHATDTAQVSALFDGLAPAGVDFINSNIIAYVPPETHYCGDNIGSEARFYNTALWGNPVCSAIVKSGKLLFEVACFYEYGPFVADGGTVALTNVRLVKNHPDGSELIVKHGGAVALTGNITLNGMRLSPDSTAQVVTSRFDAAWNPFTGVMGHAPLSGAVPVF